MASLRPATDDEIEMLARSVSAHLGAMRVLVALSCAGLSTKAFSNAESPEVLVERIGPEASASFTVDIRAASEAELHVHLEGSIRAHTVLTLAARHGVPLPARQ